MKLYRTGEAIGWDETGDGERKQSSAGKECRVSKERWGAHHKGHGNANEEHTVVTGSSWLSMKGHLTDDGEYDVVLIRD